jgi:Cd2+/Zn2+-exporting ATPase
MNTIRLTVTGMTCANCARHVQEALGAVPGVASVTVNFISQQARVELAEPPATPAQLLAAVTAAGYTATLAGKAAPAHSPLRGQLAFTIGTGLLLLAGWWFELLPLVIGAMGLAAFPIYRRAFKALLARQLDADVLVATAVTAAAAIGEYLAAGEVAFIMLLGEQLEEYTTDRARRSLGSLLSLIPPRARVRRGDAEVEVPAAAVQRGDIVVVRAGERMPVDGVVQAGTATVNQAPVTGESMPVEKVAGQETFVGTLVESGALVIAATRVGEDTTLARIATLVETAQQRNAPIQRTLDRLAGWLVPVMLALAVIVYVVTQDIHRAITVLIVTCPCALILASPTAVMAAIARAARAGVLIKGGQHLEATARLHTIVFDKTGTLTHGQPEVAHAHAFCADHNETQLVQLAAVAEKLSSHPLGRAIVRKAGPTADPAEFAVHHGRGVTARHNGQRLVVGQAGLLTTEAVPLSAELRAHVEEHHATGHTTVLVAHDNRVCGTICIADTVRASARDAIRDLRDLGLENVVMLTGDNHRVALHIAGQVGVDQVRAEVLPEQKAEHVAALKNSPRGPGVAMVGDGINDAPALAVADVGIAMGVTGTDVAHEAADVALLADDLAKIGFAVRLSRRAVRIIRQGLFFALAYNLVMITGAASGHLHMIGGAIAHQASSVIVILNAMRLLR